MTFGPAYSEKLDGKRVKDQLAIIREFMLGASVPPGPGWRTLAEVERFTGYPQASISAQLRHLRKPKFGSYTVDKRRRANAGKWEYRVTRPEFRLEP